MNKNPILSSSIWLCAALISLLSSQAVSQPTLLIPEGDQAISLEWRKPAFAFENTASALSSATYLGYRYRTSRTVSWLFELPFAYFSNNPADSEDKLDQFTLGNPYLGVRFSSVESRFSAELGVRPQPVDESSEAAYVLGILSDLERRDAFLPDITPVSLMFAVRWPWEDSPFGMRLRIGTSLWFMSGERSKGDMEILVRYGAVLYYEKGDLLAESALTSDWATLQVAGGAEDKSIYEWSLSIGYLVSAGIRPGLHFRIPLSGDIREYLDYTGGISLSYVLE